MKSFIRIFAILLAATVILTGCGGKKRAEAPAAPAAPEVVPPAAISTLVHTEGLYVGTLGSNAPDTWVRYDHQDQLIRSKMATKRTELQASGIEVSEDNQFVRAQSEREFCQENGGCELTALSAETAVQVSFHVPAEVQPAAEGAESASDATVESKEGSPEASTTAEQPAVEKTQRDLTMIISSSRTDETTKEVIWDVTVNTFKFDADATLFKLENYARVTGKDEKEQDIIDRFYNVDVTVKNIDSDISAVITSRANVEGSAIDMEDRLSLTSYVAPEAPVAPAAEAPVAPAVPDASTPEKK